MCLKIMSPAPPTILGTDLRRVQAAHTHSASFVGACFGGGQITPLWPRVPVGSVRGKISSMEKGNCGCENMMSATMFASW